MFRFRPLVIIILDGFGISTETAGNPVAKASTPNFDLLEKHFPFTTLQASGAAVGLPWGEAGNSEVGHLIIGAGKVIYHYLPRIINAIKDGSFFTNKSFLAAASHIRENKSNLHIAGLVSSGSVHSYIDHIYALCEFSRRHNMPSVFIHAFSDGKDAPPREAAQFLANVSKKLSSSYPNVRIASVVGRNYALDRSGRWDLVKTAYNLLTKGEGALIESIPEYIESCYKKGFTDQSIPPAITRNKDRTIPVVQPKDALIFSDFREDSVREIVHAFVDEQFTHFERKKVPDLLVVTLTEYEEGMNALYAFPRLEIDWPLARVVGDAGLTHLHIAETQKYAHVTYFLNGGKEDPFPGEERILIPSLMEVHPDEAPEMRAPEITRAVIENLQRYDLIIANFANADMVGHTGNYEAGIKAVEVLDKSVSQIVENVLRNPAGALIITADHGNIEKKRNTITGESLPEHSNNPVPFFLIGQMFKFTKPCSDVEVFRKKARIEGIITDVAPTALTLLGLKKSEDMTGKDLTEILL